VTDCAEDGVDGVAVMAVEVVSFEQTIGFHVAEHGLDAVSSAHLAADGRREDAAGVGDHDLQSLARDAMATVAAIHVGAADLAAGELGDLVDLGGEAVAVIGASRQGLRTVQAPFDVKKNRAWPKSAGGNGGLSSRLRGAALHLRNAGWEVGRTHQGPVNRRRRATRRP
jgi:hypothetical protein